MSKHKAKDSSKIGTGSAKSAKMIAPVVTSAVTRKSKCPPVFVEMREEIGDVTLVSEFTNTPLLVTPTNQALFPWGNKIARLYTTRKWHRLRLQYVPNTATSIGGTVMAAMNADPDKPPFSDEEELLNHQGAVNGAPYTGWTIDLLQKSNKVPIPEKFNSIQENLLGADLLEDLHTFADGVLNIAVKGLQSFFGASVSVKNVDGKTQEVKAADPPTEVVTGKFYVDYKVEYNDPVMENVDGGYAQWLQDDIDSPRPLTYPAAMFTEENVESPLINEIGVQMVSKATPPDGLNQLIGLKFASRGLYSVLLTTNAYATDAGAMLDIGDTSVVLSDFTTNQQHWYGGATSGTTSSNLYYGGSSAFFLFNVSSLATEGSGVQVDDLWCDAVITLQDYDGKFDGYTQSEARLYVMKLGNVTIDIAAKVPKPKGGLKNRHMAKQRDFFARRELAKIAQIQSAQRSTNEFMRRRATERKIASNRVIPAKASAAANVTAAVVGPAASAVGPPARPGVEAKPQAPVRAAVSSLGAAAAANGMVDTKTDASPSDATILLRAITKDDDSWKRLAACATHPYTDSCAVCLATFQRSKAYARDVLAEFEYISVEKPKDKTTSQK